MSVFPFEQHAPALHPSVWVAPGVQIIGDVEVGADSSFWYNVVVRGDVAPIRIGARTNIQDGTVVHVTSGTGPTRIGNDVLIGHLAIIHACTLHDHAFVGMGALVMDDCVIETHGMLGAGAQLTPGKRIGEGELWLGRPARFVRMLSEAEMRHHEVATARYVTLAGRHRASLSAGPAPASPDR